jgi:hypothetical protein
MSVSTRVPVRHPSLAAPEDQRRLTFEVSGVIGNRLIRINRADVGWYLKSVIRDGRDITDTPID